jgi:dTDP-4-amino-4,6-dideoxygalactose transaminase
MSDRVEFVNLKRQYQKLESEMMSAVAEVMKTQNFIQGPFVEEFERAFAGTIGAKHGVGCANGTAALSLALEALGVGPGDEVITVAHTFFATVEAIYHVGATPVLVDIEPHSYTMDPQAFEAAITPRTKAVVPVHLYGTPCDMTGIMAIAKNFGLVVIEDAAQSHLATHNGASTGSIGDCGAFSFYPGKNLGAYGDAGFVTSSSADVAARIAKLRDHGRTTKYEHELIGYNQRMDGIQAAILSVKLPYLAQWTATRRLRAAQYNRSLRRAGFKTIEPRPGTEPVYHLYVIEVSNRDDAIANLNLEGIATGVHYPVPLHRQPALSRANYGINSLPVTEKACDRVLSLPICGEISEEEVDRVVSAVLEHARP